MDFPDVTNDSFRAALLSQSGNIYNSFDADQFLLSKDLYKHTGARFLCWMIKLRVIQPFRTRWLSTITGLYSDYRRILTKRFSDQPDSPISALSQRTRVIVEGDIIRTVVWFRRLAEEMGILGHHLEDAQFRALRVIAAINVEHPEHSYTQGNDRFVWVSYLVSLFFATRGGLEVSFAEAMSYHMTCAWLSHVKVAHNIENIGYLEKHFMKLDILIEQEEPDVASLLKQCNHKALQYAMKWELTFFADEHNAHDLLLIWDYIAQNINEVNKFLRCLTVAHIRQVQIPKMADEMAMYIQRNRSWDAQKIVSDALEMMEDRREERCCQSCLRSFLNFLNDYARR